MKKMIFILSLVVFFACGEESKLNDEKFIQVYKEILIARESTPDVQAGTEKVMQILANHGMSEPEFRKMYMKLSSEKPKRLAEMIDSIRHETEVEIHKIDSVRKASKMEVDTDTTANPKK